MALNVAHLTESGWNRLTPSGSFPGVPLASSSTSVSSDGLLAVHPEWDRPAERGEVPRHCSDARSHR
jgi:hypothetical protein